MFRFLKLVLTLESLRSPMQCGLVIEVRRVRRRSGILERGLLGLLAGGYRYLETAYTVQPESMLLMDHTHLFRFRVLNTGGGFGMRLVITSADRHQKE